MKKEAAVAGIGDPGFWLASFGPDPALQSKIDGFALSKIEIVRQVAKGNHRRLVRMATELPIDEAPELTGSALSTPSEPADEIFFQ